MIKATQEDMDWLDAPADLLLTTHDINEHKVKLGDVIYGLQFKLNDGRKLVVQVSQEGLSTLRTMIANMDASNLVDDVLENLEDKREDEQWHRS